MYINYIRNHLAILPQCSNMMGTPITQAYKGTYTYNIPARMQKIKSTYVHHTYVHTYQQQRFYLVASFHQQFYSAAPSSEDQVVL